MISYRYTTILYMPRKHNCCVMYKIPQQSLHHYLDERRMKFPSNLNYNGKLVGEMGPRTTIYCTVYREHMTYISQGESCENLGHLNLYRGILLYYHMIVIYAIPIIITVTLYARIIKVLVASIETAKDMTGQVALRCTRAVYQYPGPIHGSLTRYAKLRVTHEPGMPGTFSPSLPLSDPDMHEGTCVTPVPWCMPGSLTCVFLWSRWRGKRSRHSRRMRNSQFCVSRKGLMQCTHFNAQ